MATASRCSLVRLIVILILCSLATPSKAVQSSSRPQSEPVQTWAGRRIVSLKGFGDYFISDDHGRPRLIHPEGLGVNIVAVVQRVEGDHVWIKANGAGDEAVGWLNKNDVILLEGAVPYFTSLIEQAPKDWDAYLRRAESEHALNNREAAVSDYTHAIELRPDEPFLYLRRGRSFRTMKECSRAAADFEEVIKLKPQWAEAYNMEAGVYSECPDPHYRDPQKAIALIEHAIALDVEHPTYLTVLASSYFQAGQFEKAVTTQRRALESPRFPPGYRAEATEQLREYERALAAQKSGH